MNAGHYLGGVLQGALQVLVVVQEHLDGLGLQPKLLVDLKGLVKHLVAHSDLPDRRPVKVVQSVDVVLHPGLVGLHARHVCSAGVPRKT